MQELKRSSPSGADPTEKQIEKHILLANDIAREASHQGRHPFGAILVDAEVAISSDGRNGGLGHGEPHQLAAGGAVGGLEPVAVLRPAGEDLVDESARAQLAQGPEIGPLVAVLVGLAEHGLGGGDGLQCADGRRLRRWRGRGRRGMRAGPAPRRLLHFARLLERYAVL